MKKRETGNEKRGNAEIERRSVKMEAGHDVTCVIDLTIDTDDDAVFSDEEEK